MDRYAVNGMSCAACVARVEKAVAKVPGVSSCTVSLLTNSMGVEGNAKSQDIISAVENAGYGARVLDGKPQKKSGTSISENESLLKDTQTPGLIKRLISSLAFLLILVYFSMGHMMWGWPVPSFFHGNHLALGLLEMILSAVVMTINRKFFTSGFKSLVHGAPNMDTLVAMGSGVSFAYSVAMLFAMTDAVSSGDSVKASECMENFYFEGAAMIVTLITVGKLLESISKGRTTDALKSLMKLAPKTASVIRNGKEETVPVDELVKGDVFTVRPGENIPVDGIIIEGNTAINESALTGESIPVDKKTGDGVSSATVNLSGFIKCRATRVGEDTTLSQIIRMISDAAATKAPIAKIADRVSGVFVPAVIVLSFLTFLIWIFTGAEFSFSLSRGISVLVVSCPCALGLATPVAIMVGNGIGAKNGILFKTSASLEQAGKTQIVILDKTGTLTRGEPIVTDIIPSGIDERLFLELAASLESKSEHPLAKAVMKKAEEEKIIPREVTDFSALPGNGLSGKLDGKKLDGGNMNYIMQVASGSIDAEIRRKSEELSDEGKTPIFFASDGKLLGMMAVADVLKDDSCNAVSELKSMGIHVVMLTGDNRKTADAIGKKAGVDEIIAGVLPDGKEKIVRKFMEKGRVCMVGDGINDAPALTSADTGMAIGAGTDVAIGAADVVLMKSSLLDACAAIRLSRQTVRNIKENLFWAFFYNIILIPVAAGLYHHWLGIDMNPMFGAAAMSLSSFCVVTNALRLNLFNIRNTKHDRSNIHSRIELSISADDADTEKIKEADMAVTEKTLKIEGMMCHNCERHVKEALEKIDGVDSAVADHEKKTAVVKLSKDVPDAEFEKVISDEGYTLIK